MDEDLLKIHTSYALNYSTAFLVVFFCVKGVSFWVFLRCFKVIIKDAAVFTLLSYIFVMSSNVLSVFFYNLLFLSSSYFFDNLIFLQCLITFLWL